MTVMHSCRHPTHLYSEAEAGLSEGEGSRIGLAHEGLALRRRAFVFIIRTACMVHRPSRVTVRRGMTAWGA